MNNFEKLKTLNINQVADLLENLVNVNNDCTNCIAFKYCNSTIQDCSDSFKKFLIAGGDVLTKVEFTKLAKKPNQHGQLASECCSFDWNICNVNCTCSKETKKCVLFDGKTCLLHSDLGVKNEKKI